MRDNVSLKNITISLKSPRGGEDLEPFECDALPEYQTPYKCFQKADSS